MKKILFLAFALTLKMTVFAQWSQISHPQLSGIDDRGIVNAGTAILVATDGGVFRSVDNGNTWQRSNTGLDTADIMCRDITYCHNKVWLASNGFYSSDNNGLTWSKVVFSGIDPNGWVNNIAKKGNRLFVEYNYWDNNNNHQVSVISYSDDGSQWFYGDTLGLNSNNWWNMLPDNNFALFFTDQNEQMLFYSLDGLVRDTFPLIGLPANAQIKNRLLSIDSSGTTFLWINENNPEIYKFNFATQQWEVKTSGISNADAIFSAYTLGSVAFASVFSSTPFPAITLYRSLDSANTWVPMLNPGILLPMLQGSMLKVGNRILCTELFSDLYISDNNGQLWTKNTNFMSFRYNSIIALNNGDLLTTRGSYGILKSTDNGTTWTQFNGDLPNMFGIYMTEGILFDGSSTLFSIGSTSPDGPHSLFKSINSGQNWTELTNAPDSSRMNFIKMIGNRLMVYFFEDNNGSYQFSTDQGANWTNISPAINALGLNRVVGFNGNNDTIFVFGYDNSNQDKIYMSVNNGLLFTPVNNGLNVPNSNFVVQNLGDWRFHPQVVAANGNNNQGLVLTILDYNVYPNQLRFYTLNSSLTWAAISQTGIEVPHNVKVGPLKFKNGIWYVATSIGLFASSDGCQSWGKIWNNQGLQMGMSIDNITLFNNRIYLGTNGNGIWKTQILSPSLTTKPVSNITGSQALSGGIFTDIGGMPFVTKGICFATHTLPTVNDITVITGSNFDNFDALITNLNSGQTYYVKAFVITPTDTIYGNELTFTTTTIINAQINPVTADYGLLNPGNVTTNILWNDASAISSIVDNNMYNLMPTDYFVNGNVLYITQSYLSNVLLANGQSITLTINFDIGTPSTFIITAVQTSINHAQLIPNTAFYDLTIPTDIETEVVFNDASSLTTLVDNQSTPYVLTGSDYSFSVHTLTISQTYLATVLTSLGDSILITVGFNVGNSATLLIKAIETISPELNPDAADFIVNIPQDVKTTIDWNDALYVTSIVDNQLVPYSLTTLDYNINVDTLTLFASYLSTVIPNDSDEVVLTINFNNGCLKHLS
ncbi:MAG: X2-like carbohydrate binding domain-containing protein [Bacteroidales bacterium]|nr:X2-like carbohydrate binding domain-containing protein [Bacteroidales bacterium]